jgi:predicted membrane channel-forming protein YqfA (hemolysin III family)
VRIIFYVSLSGCLGVAVAAPIVTHLNLSALRWLLFLVVSYNAYGMVRAYRKGKREENA